MKIFCLNPFFVHFVVLVYALKTVEEKIQSGTEALGGPAGGHGESKDEGIVFVKPSPNTNEVCKENSQKKNIFYLYLTCVVKISILFLNSVSLQILSSLFILVLFII